MRFWINVSPFSMMMSPILENWSHPSNLRNQAFLSPEPVDVWWVEQLLPYDSIVNALAPGASIEELIDEYLSSGVPGQDDPLF